MTRRALPIALVAVLVAGIATGTCLQGRCPSMRAMQPETWAADHHGTHDGTPAGASATAPATAHDGMHAAAHGCCDRTGITGPHCCPTVLAGAEPSPAASGRPSDVVPLVATRVIPLALTPAAAVRRETPRRFDPGAPPGTLIEQHTSLLV
jgi:hypothetical protein